MWCECFLHLASQFLFLCQATCTFSFRILTSNAVNAREEISRCAFRPQFLARDSQSYAVRKATSCSLNKAEVCPKTPRIKKLVCRWKFTYSEGIENHIGVLVGESFLNSRQALPSPMLMQRQFVLSAWRCFVLHGSVHASLSL